MKNPGCRHCEKTRSTGAELKRSQGVGIEKTRSTGVEKKNRTTHRRNDKAIGRRKAGKHEGGGDGDVANHGIGWWGECDKLAPTGGFAESRWMCV